MSATSFALLFKARPTQVRHLFITFLLLAALSLLSGCVTQKDFVSGRDEHFFGGSFPLGKK
jgi:hypothetical protein